MKLLKLLASALALVALAACSNMINDLSPGGGTADGADVTSTAASLSVALLGAGNTDLSAVKGNLQLPEVGADDTTVTWSSDTPATVSATGVVTRPATTAATVVLTATITKGTTTVTKTFTVVVTPIPTDPTTAIADDTSTLVAAILKGPNADLNSVKGPLTLPTVGPSGTTITWSSDNAAVSASGNVTRPAVGGTAATVTLTATITKASGTTETKTFTVTVQPLSSDPATAAAEDKAALTSALLAGGSPDLSNVKGPLVLPSTGPGGSTITWSSDIPTTLTGAGTVTRPAAGEAAKTVVLTATITNGTTTTTKTFTVTVLPLSATATATETIAEDKTTLTDNVLKGVNPDLAQVKASLTLPTTGASGSTISWATSNSSVVTSTGTITRPAAGTAAVTVTMTATITKAGGTTETKTFTVVVQPIPSDPVVALAEDKASLAALTILGTDTNTNTDTTNVTGNLTLPTTGASGTTIAWTSSDAAVITNTGTVTRPATGAADVSVTLTATLSKTGATDVTKTFAVTVKAGASTTTTTTGSTTVNLLDIQGLTAPVTGTTPDTTITETAQYTATVTWSPAHSTFAASEYYTAGIFLTARSGWTFVGVAAASFTVAGASAVDNNAGVTNTLYVMAEFPPTAAAEVSTFAGSSVSGSWDATGAAATFNSPRGITVDSSGNLYVADMLNHKIRKITTTGVVTTFAGSGTLGGGDGTGILATFNQPYGMAIDPSNNLYVSEYSGNRIRKITAAGVVTTIANAVGFSSPTSLAYGTDGNLYVADYTNNLIKKVTMAGVVTDFAGDGSTNNIDGTGTSAQIQRPEGLVFSGTDLYAVQMNRLRKITSAGVVTTVAGDGTSPSLDGTGTAARFNLPRQLTVDPVTGDLYIAENSIIRKVTSSFVVTTVAGSATADYVDGSRTEARFKSLNGIVLRGGALYVADSDSNCIRKVVLP